MCGASKEQKDLEAQQAAFYKQTIQQQQEVFAPFQNILESLQSAWEPILAAGINQKGFSDAETTALNTQATEGTANEYNKALRATNEGMAAAGGGDEFLPSGAAEQVRGNIAAAAAGQQASALNQIKQADYATGRQNFFAANGALSGSAGLYNPAGFAGAATGAGDAAGRTAESISQANNAWMGPVFGALGGIGGAAVAKKW